MKHIILALIMTAGLTACGADGEPIRPTAGVTVGTGGVSVGGSVGTTIGGVNVRVGV